MPDRKRQASKDSSELRSSTPNPPTLKHSQSGGQPKMLKQSTLDSVVTSKNSQPAVSVANPVMVATSIQAQVNSSSAVNIGECVKPASSAVSVVDEGKPAVSVTDQASALNIKQQLKEALMDPDITQMFTNLLTNLIVTHTRDMLVERDREIDNIKQDCMAMKHHFDSKIERLEDLLDQQQAYGRRNCLIINGYPEKEDENTDDIVIELAKKMKADIKLSDISRSHRLGKTGNTTTRSLIVKFISWNARAKFISNRKLLYRSDDPIYINENLTPRRAELFRKCRSLFKKKVIDSCWTYVGQVYIRKFEGSICQVKNFYDLEGLDE